MFLDLKRNAHDNSLLAKIDTDGNPEWVIGFGGDNTSGGCSWPIYDADDHSYDVVVDDDGFIYVTGFSQDTMQILIVTQLQIQNGVMIVNLWDTSVN